MATEGQAAPAAAPAAPADPIAAIDALLAKGDGALQPVGAKAQEPAAAEAEQDYQPGENKQTEGTEEDPPEEKSGAELTAEQLEAIALEVTVKGDDGKDVVEKPTIKELREGYMRQKDYSRKTQDVARARDEVAETVKKAVESERTSYAHTLSQLNELVLATAAAELKDVNWDHLAANDAFEYVRLKNRADQLQRTLSSIQGKQQEVTKKQADERQAAVAKAAAQAREVLQNDIPGWNDATYQRLMKVGVENFGYKPDEVAAWVDPRAIKLLHAAEQFLELKAGKPPADKKVVNAPKVIKPGAAPDVSQRQQRDADAMKRLQGSGQIRDAAAVIAARMR